MWLFLTTGAVNKDIKSKRKFWEKGHNMVIMVIIFWDFSMFDQTFPSQQVELDVIVKIDMVYTSCLTSS